MLLHQLHERFNIPPLRPLYKQNIHLLSSFLLLRFIY